MHRSQSNHAIFVSERATAALDVRDDRTHMMTTAELVPGTEAEAAIERLFHDPEVAYLHAHIAARGCFAAGIERG